MNEVEALLMYQRAVESGCSKDDLIACYAHAENVLHAPRVQIDEIARGALAPGGEEHRRAHSKSEYKRRVAQGDPNVLPPEPCTLPDCSCPIVGGLPQCQGAAAACGVDLPAARPPTAVEDAFLHRAVRESSKLVAPGKLASGMKEAGNG